MFPAAKAALLKDPGENSGATASRADPHSAPVKASKIERVLICARCGLTITSRRNLMQIDGKTHHTFVNPHSLIFQILCFSRARGCVASGPSSRHWTWFPGYRWQVQLCASCSEHLGWLFRCTEHRFWGLIADKLIEIDPPLKQ